MNDKRVVFIVGVIVIILLGVSVFFTFKKRIFTGDKAKVEIKCNGSDTTGELKVNDSFSCSFYGTNYTFTVTSIKDNKMVIKSSSEGLTEVKSDGTISLLDKKDTFEITKGETLKLAPQVTDGHGNLVIEWK